MGFNSIQNKLLPIGIISLAAERMLQYASPKSKEISDLMYVSTWMCKAVQAITFYSYYEGVNLLSMYLSALTTVTTYMNYKSKLISTTNKGMPKDLGSCMLTLFNQLPKLFLIGVAGYWADRSVRVTEKTGPIMALTSLGLLTLSFFSLKYDLKHLSEQTEFVREQPQREALIERIEDVVENTMALSCVAYFAKVTYDQFRLFIARQR